MQAGKRAVTLQAGLCASYPLLHSDYDYDYILFIRIRYIFREVDVCYVYHPRQMASSELITENEKIILGRLSALGISGSFACGLYGSRASDHHPDAGNGA